MATNKPPMGPPQLFKGPVVRDGDAPPAGRVTSRLEAFPYSLGAHRVVTELDVFEHDGALTICADLPALKLDEASVRVTDTYVRVEGERRPPAERVYGRFSRTVRLPVNANAAAVTWTFEKGVLQITIPLLEQDTWTPAA
jgi:HSP20 family molecular chaperone IbpA